MMNVHTRGIDDRKEWRRLSTMAESSMNGSNVVSLYYSSIFPIV
jgi:hypothetical protein